MSDNILQIGAKIPQFNLSATDGKRYGVDSFVQAKVLIVLFSCNHCPYVQAYEERIIAIQKDYANVGVQVIAINSNDAVDFPDDSFDNMKVRAQQRNFNFPYLRDESQDTAKAFGASHTPELFAFDTERNLVYYGKIDDNWKEEDKVKHRYLRNALDEIIAGKPVSVPETFAIGC
jgi:thiol-disulfide isomerase/thioredoxin